MAAAHQSLPRSPCQSLGNPAAGWSLARSFWVAGRRGGSGMFRNAAAAAALGSGLAACGVRTPQQRARGRRRRKLGVAVRAELVLAGWEPPPWGLPHGSVRHGAPGGGRAPATGEGGAVSAALAPITSRPTPQRQPRLLSLRCLPCAPDGGTAIAAAVAAAWGGAGGWVPSSATLGNNRITLGVGWCGAI